MKKIVCLISLLVAVAEGKGQPNYSSTAFTPADENVTTFDNFLKRPLCLSGLTAYNGLLYFASEWCRQIIIFDAMGKYQSTISYTGMNEGPGGDQVEGITFFNDGIYLSTESLDKVSRVYRLQGLGLSTVAELMTFPGLPIAKKTAKDDVYGIEGIAGNDKARCIYITVERPDYGVCRTTKIYTFLGDKTGLIWTKKTEQDVILSDDGNEWRFSDLFFDANTNRLLCLKSRFGEYKIESISVDEVGNLITDDSGMIKTTTLTVIRIPTNIAQDRTNLEGLCLLGTDAYIVSDTHDGPPDSRPECNVEYETPSLILKLQKPATSETSRKKERRAALALARKTEG